MNSSIDFYEEQWQSIKGYEGLYLISSWGRIMALDYQHQGKCRILKLTSTKGRYLKVSLRNQAGSSTTYRVHRLVALAFIPNPEGKPQVDHIDGDKYNNNASNLRWVDGVQNCNNPNTKPNYHHREKRPGEWERRSAGQKKRFERPEERAKLMTANARGRETAMRNRLARKQGLLPV